MVILFTEMILFYSKYILIRFNRINDNFYMKKSYNYDTIFAISYNYDMTLVMSCNWHDFVLRCHDNLK